MEWAGAFLPVDRRRALTGGPPVADRVSGAALFADISGFTPLTTALAHELGPRLGAEELIRQLNRVYTALIGHVHGLRGDVINFSGDAITCWFDDAEEGGAIRAVACAHALQAEMARLRSVETPGGTSIPLGLKVAIAAGPARRLLAGDPAVYVIEILAGGTLDRMAAAEKLAGRGEIVVTSEVAAAMPGLAVTAWREHGGERFAALARQEPPEPEAAPAPAVDEATARPWLLPPVFAHLQVMPDAFLAGLRSGVSLFLKFSGIDYDRDDDAGDKLDAFVRAAQGVLKRFEGYIIQITMGDKGSYLYASFGAPVAHEDDTARAAAAALALRDLVGTLDFFQTPQIGISRGLVHSGAYGSPDRRTYGVIGNEVNIAARLMTAAAPGQILISERVAELIGGEFDLEELPPVRLKGVEGLFAVWQLRGRSAARAGHRRSRAGQLVGREPELAQVQAALDELCAGRPATLLIEGPPGIGKSLVVEELLRRIGDVGEELILALAGSGDAVEATTPYFAWRSILAAALRPAGVDTPAASDLIEHLPGGLRALTPLLNAILPLGLPESELTAQMTGEARQENTQELVVAILREAAGRRGLALILDDAHWLDSASWSLIRRIRREAGPVLLSLAGRPMGDAAPAAYVELLDRPDARLLALDTLPGAAIEELVARRLGARRLPPLVARLIHDKAEGNPFFSEELALALRDAGLIDVADGEIRLSSRAGDLSALDFPTTIQGIITSRVDLLPPPEQLTIKVASVIGRIFAFRLLRDAYPTSVDEAQLHRHLDDLARLEIALPETPEPDLAYLFKHIVTQEVVYSLMTFAQRRQLHERVALRLEAQGEAEQVRDVPRLAYHWQQAGAAEKAAVYYERAGESAFRGFANQEAIRFLSLAAELAGPGVSTLRRARWERLMGEAAYRLTQMEESKAHYSAALALVGRAVPRSMAGNALRLTAELARQSGNRLLSRRLVTLPPDSKESLLEAARSYEGVAEVFYNEGNLVASFRCVMAALNLADRAGPSAELARGYANMVGTLGTASLNGLAEGYRARAVALAANLGDKATLAGIQVPLASQSLWVGAWERADTEVAQALEIYAQLGEWRQWGVAAWLRPQVAQSRGEPERARELWAELVDVAGQHRDTRHEVRGRGGQFFNYLALGRAADAERVAVEIGALLDDNPEMAPVEERLWLGVNARRALERGDLATARAFGHEQLAAIGRARFKFDLLEVFAGPAEVLLGLAERGEATIEEARQGCRTLDGYARTYAFARPRALRCRGRLAYLEGKREAAAKQWQKSLTRAEALGMAGERALTLAAAARMT